MKNNLNAPQLFTDLDIGTLGNKVPEGYTPEVLPGNGEKLTYVIDKQYAYDVLDKLMYVYENNLPPYSIDKVRLPQDPRHMPKTLIRGGKDHAMFFFNVCYYMKGGIKSNEAVKRMGMLFDNHPELFDCTVASEFNTMELVEILTAHGLGFQERVSREWVENAKRLQERFNGDPRNIFEGVSTYEHSLGLLRNDGKGGGFLGFQKKMTSMIIYYLMDEGLIDPFVFPIPIDLHVMRVSIANELIKFPNAPYGTNLFTDETIEALMRLYFDYSIERRVNPLRLCDAVWMLSESFCGKHPGNSTIEPLGRGKRQGRSTYLIAGVVNEKDPTQQAAYASSCAVCPIEKTCRFNIPGTQYYVGGNIIIRGERQRFQSSLLAKQVVQETLF